MAKKKKQTPKRSAGRPRYNFEYVEARELVRAEMLKSETEFKKWWALNRPTKIPKNPARAYKKEWIGWADFIGHYNPFPMVRKGFRSFSDCRAYAHSLKLTSREKWYEVTRSEEFPADIPVRPDIIFRNNKGRAVEWISWRDFLGYKVTDRIANIGTTDHIILITKYRNKPSNVYDIGITNLGKAAILENQSQTGFVIVGAYYHDKTSNWVALINRFMSQYDETSYIIQNVAEILNILSMHYLTVNW